MGNGLRKLLIPSCAAVLFVARAAGAQEAGQGMHKSGGFILSAERLFGLSFWSFHQERDAVPVAGATALDTTTSGTSFSLLFGSNVGSTSTGTGGSIAGALPSPYMTPRLAFDFLPIESLTVGGSIGFLTSSGETESLNNVVPRDTATITIFALTPRIGYVIPITDAIYFWPRVGITYFSWNATTNPPPPVPPAPQQPEVSATLSGFAIDIEPAFVFAVVPHFGISVTPVADIPLAGSISQDPADPNEPETRVKIRNIGATVGILGFF